MPRSGWIRLERLLNEPLAGRCLCFWKDQSIHSEQLAPLLGPLVEKLRDSAPGGWLLFAQDSWHFTLGLLALWADGRPALLPPNDQPETLALWASEAVGFLGERDPGLGLPWIDLGSCKPGPALSPRLLDPQRLALRLFTSGTTGEPKGVDKKLSQLADEVAAQESVFGDQGGNGAVFSTVSHQHIYGLLFRLLWPLCAGRPFARKAHFYPEELIADLSPGALLISGPAHLKRIPQLIEWSDLAAVDPLIFSSGGPLPSERAEQYRSKLGRAPIEMFGSTETGGVAWRQVQAEDPEPLWTPLPQVETQLDSAGMLVVRSPYVSLEPGQTWLVMGDRAEITPMGLRLLGRGDRIVKIEEKRLSLPEMEARLEACVWVERAWLVPLEGSRLRLGAALVASEAAAKRLAAGEEKALIGELKEYLAGYYEAILRPRTWIWLEQFPLDPQGKIDRLALLGHFNQPQMPVEHQRLAQADRLRLRLEVPAQLRWCQGHFEGDPLVPGVASLDWAQRYLEEHLGEPAALKEAQKIKFGAPLKPGQVFWLELRRQGEQSWAFSLTEGGLSFGSGLLVVEA
ncbi:MAG: AMP-binding protein [bacterium]|nr:AMP-binding protein [bacterium]